MDELCYALLFVLFHVFTFLDSCSSLYVFVLLLCVINDDDDEMMMMIWWYKIDAPASHCFSAL